MPVHDWTRVFPGTFHDFHSSWITHIKEALNGGLFPEGFYALSEQQAGEATTYRAARRTLVIRHRSARRIVAMIEILSPGNKDGEQHFRRFVDKAAGALQQGIHLLAVDLHPPGRWDPDGIHGAIWPIVGGGDFHLPDDKRLTAAAYLAETLPQAFVEPLAVGDTLPDMPLFIRSREYVPTPLEKTYTAAYDGVPAFVRDIVEGLAPAEE